MLFKKVNKIEEIKKKYKEHEKEYKEELEKLLKRKIKENEEIEINENIEKKNEEQIEILNILENIRNNSEFNRAQYLKEAVNNGSIKAGMNFLKYFCNVYPEDCIKIYNKMKKYKEEDFYNEVKEIKNINKEYFNMLKEIYINLFMGIVYLKLDKIEEGEEHLKEAVKKGKCKLAELNLGIINYNRNETEEAKKYFEKCKIETEEANYYLAIINLKENKLEEAIRNFKECNTYSARRNTVVLKLKEFFSYGTINECIEKLIRECNLITEDKNLLGELYLMKKEITFDLKYKQEACYQFGYANNIERLNQLLEEGINKRNKEILNGLACLKERIKGVKEITEIAEKASEYLKEIEDFKRIEKDLRIEEYYKGNKYIYNKNRIDIYS